MQRPEKLEASLPVLRGRRKERRRATVRAGVPIFQYFRACLENAVNVEKDFPAGQQDNVTMSELDGIELECIDLLLKSTRGGIRGRSGRLGGGRVSSSLLLPGPSFRRTPAPRQHEPIGQGRLCESIRLA